MSAWALDAWRLPSTVAFLEEVERGLALAPALVLRASPSMPDGLAPALGEFLIERGRHLMPTAALPGRTPASLLGELLGLEPELDALAQDGFDHVAFVDLRDAGAAGAGGLEAWTLFLGRLAAARANRPFGLAVVLLVAEEGPTVPKACEVAWGGRLRRSDVAVWTEVNAPLDRGEPLATLATALAVELCGWRLDLAAGMARSRDEDLVDPLSWLAARSADAGEGVSAGAERGDCMLNGMRMACPVRLHREGARDELARRIWRAQLTALFPWLEERRQALIARYGDRLRLDPDRYARTDRVEDLELAAVAFQLDERLPRDEAAMLHALRRIRNNLAHRDPANQADLLVALRWRERTRP
jgi:hypothetical protein